MNKILEKFANKKIAILGFGKEGISSYKFLTKHLNNLDITIIDKNEKIKDMDIFNNNTKFNLGNDYLSNIEEFDIILKTPGIDVSSIPSIKEKIVSQVSLLLECTNYNIIGITGTKGKSTTSSLIYKIIKDQNDSTFLLGNIGNPIFDYIDEFNDDSNLVVELSAHQLEYVTSSPHISILLNLFEEHLDFFHDKEKYYLAKLNIFKYKNEEDYALYGSNNNVLVEYINNNNYKGKKIPISLINKNGIYKKENYIYINDKKIYNLSDERLLIGEHNIQNIMFAIYVSYILELDLEKVVESINKFEPLPHRLQKVGTYKGITFYNDTIATIPESSLNGIKSLEKVDTLILGGMDRGIDYSLFPKELLKTGINNFICMPETGNKIGKELEKTKNVYYIDDLEDAVKLAYKITEKGKICLLSPAAPSYNKYKNFEEKGKSYIEFIKKYSNE